MSSDDEIGGFQPTTPGPVQKKAKPAPRPVQRAVAGPSSKPQKAGAKKTARKEPEAVVPDGADVTMISSDEDDSTTRKTAANKGKTKAAQTTNNHTNGVTNAKPKGKAKADEPSQTHVEVLEVDDIPPPAADPPPPTRMPKSRSTSKPSPAAENSAAAKREKREMEALKRENERLQRRLDDADTRNQKLTEQLKRLLEIRETEPEKALEERIAQYEATTRAQELLIREQSTQLAHFKVLADSNRLGEIPFLSREQADAEMKKLENKVRSLGETVKSKDSKIAELQEECRHVQMELENEIKMAKAQQPRRNEPIQKPGSNKKKDKVVELYERLTNFLVLNVEHSTFKLYDLPQTRYVCLYTFIQDPVGEPSGYDPSLSFELFDTWARKDGQALEDIVSPDELEEKTMYIPRDLDKQPEEFRQRLQFFSEEFLFTPSQLSVFLRTLAEQLGQTMEVDDEGGQGDQSGYPNETDELMEEGDVEVLVDNGKK